VHVTHDQEEAMMMADTIAVMNAGVIEQLGSPAELYDHPATTFAANFLGQSNLVAGRVIGADGDSLELEVQGTRVSAAKVSSRVRTGDAWVGVRPEKVGLVPSGTAPAGVNVLAGGTITDASFVGVSIQYLVRMPWGQELTVFTQNNGAQDPFDVSDRADLTWRPEHTFVLDARQDATAGADLEDEG
jgi:spermidine/putrescine transport system ATP-binding protein